MNVRKFLEAKREIKTIEDKLLKELHENANKKAALAESCDHPDEWVDCISHRIEDKYGKTTGITENYICALCGATVKQKHTN
jgi:hypothetical protein